MTFFVAMILVSIPSFGLLDLTDQASGEGMPLAVTGFVVDTEGNPIEDAAVTMTIFDVYGGVRATRYFTSLANGAYQSFPDFDPLNWSIGDRLEVVAEYGSDYGSNYTILDSENLEYSWAPVDITYPFKLAEPFEIKLIDGWNFVTVPKLGGGYNASNLPGLATGDSISSWNAETQTYGKTYIKGITPPAGDFDIAPSTGYWINVGSDRTVSLTMGWISPGSQARTITLPRTNGWVNLAFNTLNVSWMASQIPGMYGPGTVFSVSWYNPVSKTYQTYVSGLPPSDFALRPGQAYWVWVKGGGTFTYTP